MIVQHFRQFASYNAWANARLFGAAVALPSEAYRRPLGLFFGSLQGTLNHLLVADRIWLKRLTGEGDAPTTLDVLLFDDLTDLISARIAEDVRIVDLIAGYDDAALDGEIDFLNTAGQPFRQRRSDILAHFFNHQTHHRGQAHSALSILGGDPPSLDLLAYQRGLPAPDLAALALQPARE